MAQYIQSLHLELCLLGQLHTDTRMCFMFLFWNEWLEHPAQTKRQKSYPVYDDACFIRTVSWRKGERKKSILFTKWLTTFKVKRCAHQCGKRSTAIGYYNIYNMVETQFTWMLISCRITLYLLLVWFTVSGCRCWCWYIDIRKEFVF